MKGDLHVHTTLSDGSLGVEDVIAQAKRIGLDFISITDHDTMSSISRAKVLGDRYGIQTIPGVELTAWDKTRGRKVHILCYAPQKPDRLEGICRRCSEIRQSCAKETVENVLKLYPITAEDITKHVVGSKSIYKQHILHALIEYGYSNHFYGKLNDELFNEIMSEKLSTVMNKNQIKYNITPFFNGSELITALNDPLNRFDVVFLDVDMPGVNGENVAQYINSSKASIPVIFVTNHDDFVFSSFKYRPFGFLRKSHVDSELEEAVIRLDNYLSKSGQCYTFTFQGKLISLPYNKIKYIEAYGHEVVIHTTDTDIRTTRSLSETEKALSSYGFIRIHKSFIVNTRFIFSVERNNIILTDNNSLPVSRTKTEEIKQAMIKFARD